jgi:uncharacterized protein involved in exopolysaccharide biosynthesis
MDFRPLKMHQNVAGDTPVAPGVERALGPLRAHLAFIVVFVVSASASALALTYIYSEQYQSEATIFFKPKTITRLIGQQTEALGSPVPTTPFKVIGQTLAGLVKSDALLRSVVADLRLDVDDPKDYSGPWYVSWYRRAKDYLSGVGSDAWSILKYGRVITEEPVAHAIRDLRKHVKVDHEDSYVFTVHAINKKPEVAASIADTVANRLADMLRRENQLPEKLQREELERLLASKTAIIKDLESRMRDLLVSNHVGSLQPEIENGSSRLSQLELARAKVEAQLRQEEARINGLTDKLGALAIVRDSGLGQNYSKFNTEKLTTEVNSGGLRENRASIERSIAKLRADLQQLSQIKVDYDLMSNELEAAQRNYEILSGALQETVIRQTTAQTELHIREAQASELPQSPIKIYHVGLAAILATIVSIGLAYVFSYFQFKFFMNPGGPNDLSFKRATKTFSASMLNEAE